MEQSDEDLIDPAPLAMIRQLQQPGTDDVAARVVQTYCADAPKLIERMKESLQSADAETLRRAAHSLKSSSASVGVKRIASLSKEVEILAKANDLVHLDAMIAAIDAEYLRGARALLAAVGLESSIA